MDCFGRTFTQTIHGCTEAAFIILQTRHPLYVDYFAGNASQTTFTVTKGTDVIHDQVTASPIMCFVDGVQTAVSMSTLGVATISPAPADGAKICILYQYTL